MKRKQIFLVDFSVVDSPALNVFYYGRQEREKTNKRHLKTHRIKQKQVYPEHTKWTASTTTKQRVLHTWIRNKWNEQRAWIAVCYLAYLQRPRFLHRFTINRRPQAREKRKRKKELQELQHAVSVPPCTLKALRAFLFFLLPSLIKIQELEQVYHLWDSGVRGKIYTGETYLCPDVRARNWPPAQPFPMHLSAFHSPPLQVYCIKAHRKRGW